MDVMSGSIEEIGTGKSTSPSDPVKAATDEQQGLTDGVA